MVIGSLVFGSWMPLRAQSGQGRNESSKKIQSSKSKTKSKINREYGKIIKSERRKSNRASAVEGIMSGVAAVVIGVYGYYNDDRGLLTKVLYSATQTAGVIVASTYLFDLYAPRTVLSLDEYLLKNGDITYSTYKNLLVSVEKQRRSAEVTQMAYSSGVLSLLYGYNGFRENNKGLSNVFYFLSFNFALISTVSFVQMAGLKNKKNVNLDIGLLSGTPQAVLTYRF